MWEEKIELHTMYDFDYTLYRLSYDPMISLQRDERLVKIPVVFDGDYHIVTVQAIGTTAKPSFIVRSDSEEYKDQIISRIFDLFQWDRELEKIQSHFQQTNLDKLFRDYPATPIVRDFDLYYCLMKTIIHQQLNMKFAYVLTTRFIEQFGEQVDGVWFYPTPEKIANLQVEDLRKLQFSGRKAEYVIDTSKKIAAGELNLEELKDKADEEVIKELVKIRGIGTWTAENWLLFGLGREDLFPKADIGIQNAVKQYFGLERKPTIEELEAFSSGWEPYRSFASLTLWRSIE